MDNKDAAGANGASLPNSDYWPGKDAAVLLTAGAANRSSGGGATTGTTAQIPVSILTMNCCNLSDAAKQDLEALLLAWCQRHSAPGGCQQHELGPGQQQEQPGQQEGSRTLYAAPATATSSQPTTGRLWSGSLSLTLPLDTHQRSTPARLESQDCECGAPGFMWEDRMRPHKQPLAGWEQSGAKRRDRRSSWTAGRGDAKVPAGEKCTSTITPEPIAATDTTTRILLKAQASSAAVAFNVAYDKENNTPAYDRLRIAPLLLGAGLAATAVPSVAMPPPLALTQGGATHGSEEAPSVALMALVASPMVRANGAGDGNTASARPLKRRRTDNEGPNGGGGGAGGGGLGAFSFVLNRCWNCGSYGHDIQGCYRPRDAAAIESRRRAFTEGRAATAALRAARQAARRARRLGPSEARYFSFTKEEGVQSAAFDPSGGSAAAAASAAAPLSVRDTPLTVAPAGVRPGALSRALAAALGMESTLDPPPWLTQMALYGIPPAYRHEGCVAAAPPSPPPPVLPLIRVYGADGVPVPLPSDGDGKQDVKGDASSSDMDTQGTPPTDGDKQADPTTLDPAKDTSMDAVTLHLSHVPVASEGTCRDGPPQEVLFPCAPKHVAYPGLNAPIPQAACHERWGKVLEQARRAVAVVEAAKEAVRRRQQQGQEHPPDGTAFQQPQVQLLQPQQPPQLPPPLPQYEQMPQPPQQQPVQQSLQGQPLQQQPYNYAIIHYSCGQPQSQLQQQQSGCAWPGGCAYGGQQQAVQQAAFNATHGWSGGQPWT